MSLLCDAFPSIDTVCVNTGEVKISKKTLSFLIWYDNEAGYVSQIINSIKRIL